MKKMRKILITLFVMVMLLSMVSIAIAAEDIPNHTQQFYVNDFANVLTEEEKQTLQDYAVNLDKEQNGMQIVIVTVNNTGTYTIDKYVNEMYNKYKIGSGDGLGFLIVLSMEERDFRIEIGRGMEGYVSASKAGSILRSKALSLWGENKFGEGFIALQKGLAEEAIKQIAKTNSKEAQTVSESTNPKENSNAGWIFLAILVVIIGLAIIIACAWMLIKAVQKRKQAKLEKERKITQLEEELKTSKANVQRIFNQAKESKTSFEKEIYDLNEKNEAYQKKIQEMTEWTRRARILHSKLDIEIHEMIEAEKLQQDKQKAESFNQTYAQIDSFSPDKQHVSKLNTALAVFGNMTDRQKSFVCIDMKKVGSIYTKSEELKKQYEREQEIKQNKKDAAEVAARITAGIALISIAKARNLRDLEGFKRKYDNLNREARSYFDQSVLSKLEELIQQARRDKQREEEEERQRRRREEERRREEQRRAQQSSYHSSSGSSGGFSGHGGSSSGSGVSGKF